LSCHVVAKTHPTVSARPSGCGATPDYRPGDTKVEQLLDTVERNLLLSTEGTFRARIEFAPRVSRGRASSQTSHAVITRKRGSRRAISRQPPWWPRS